MFADLPPKLWTPPAIIRAAEPWEIEARTKLAAIGVPRKVRADVIRELKRIRGCSVVIAKPTLDDLKNYAGIDAQILPGIGVAAGLFRSNAAPASIVWTDHQVVTATGVAQGFTASIGTADPTRVVLVCFSTGQAGIVSATATIASAPATPIQVNTAGSTGGSAMFLLAVPTGTTANVVVTWGASQTRHGMGVWSMYNLQSSTPTNSAQSSANPLSMAVPVLAGGVIAGYAMGSSGTLRTWTWSLGSAGAAENFDEIVAGTVGHSGASANFAAAESVTATATPSGSQTTFAGVAASFR